MAAAHFPGLWLDQRCGARARDRLTEGEWEGIPGCRAAPAGKPFGSLCTEQVGRGVPPDRHWPFGPDGTAQGAPPEGSLRACGPDLALRDRRGAAQREEARGAALRVGSAFPGSKMPKKKPTPIQLNPAPDGSAVNGTSSAE